MKKYYYHGTSADNLPDIKKNGLKIYTNKIWSCSGNSIYLWSPDKLKEFNEVDNMGDAHVLATQLATESAQIACVKSKKCQAVVLKILIDEEHISLDTSCEYMEHSGAVCVDRDIRLNEIVEIMVSNDLSLLRGIFMSYIIGREYSNIELSEIEIKIAESMKSVDIYPEDIAGLTIFKKIRK